MEKIGIYSNGQLKLFKVLTFGIRFASSLMLKVQQSVYQSMDFRHSSQLIKNTRCQFHQRFLRVFFVRTSFRQLFSSYIWLGAKILFEKCEHLTLMKLTTSVNFVNVLRTSFVPVDPKSTKRYWRLDWILTLLGAMCVKAVHRTLMKLRPGSSP